MPTTDRLAAGLTELAPHGAVALTRRPWTLRCAGTDLRVRGAVPADLARVALLHGRCSADTLLQRYLAGGRAPFARGAHGPARRTAGAARPGGRR